MRWRSVSAVCTDKAGRQAFLYLHTCYNNNNTWPLHYTKYTKFRSHLGPHTSHGSISSLSTFAYHHHHQTVCPLKASQPASVCTHLIIQCSLPTSPPPPQQKALLIAPNTLASQLADTSTDTDITNQWWWWLKSDRSSRRGTSGDAEALPMIATVPLCLSASLSLSCCFLLHHHHRHHHFPPYQPNFPI